MATYAGFAASETDMQAPTVSEHAPSVMSDATAKTDGKCEQSQTAPVSHGLRNRVQRVEASLHLGRPVTDAELLQHSRDCSDLMHVCYGLFEAGKGVSTAQKPSAGSTRPSTPAPACRLSGRPSARHRFSPPSAQRTSWTTATGLASRSRQTRGRREEAALLLAVRVLRLRSSRVQACPLGAGR
jgi:hypothetical protein